STSSVLRRPSNHASTAHSRSGSVYRAARPERPHTVHSTIGSFNEQSSEETSTRGLSRSGTVAPDRRWLGRGAGSAGSGSTGTVGVALGDVAMIDVSETAYPAGSAASPTVAPRYRPASRVPARPSGAM